MGDIQADRILVFSADPRKVDTVCYRPFFANYRSYLVENKD
jgi:hypothetical protein